MLTLTNDFHNSQARVRVDVPGIMSRAQVQRAQRKLCGISDCTCGGVRGPQYHDGRRIELEDQVDGSVKIYYA